MPLAERALTEYLTRRSSTPEVPDIERVVAGHFQVTPAQIRSKSRDRTVSLARAVTMHLVRKHTSLSFPEIGRALGNKNHSTVLMATQRIDRILTADGTVRWKSDLGHHESPLRETLNGLEEALFVPDQH